MGMSPSADLVFGIDLGDDGWYEMLSNVDEALIEQYEEGEIDEIVDLIQAIERPDLGNPYTEYPSNEELRALQPEAKSIFDFDSRAAMEKWEAQHPEWTAWYENYKRVRVELEETIPIDLSYYGDMSRWSGKVLALKGYTVGCCGACGPIPKLSDPTQQEIGAAIEFCKKYGLPDFSEAQWLLTATFG